MSYRIKKVAVLGSGVMGSGIACHLANVGMEVLMLDILPTDLVKATATASARNRIADEALMKAIKSKPAALFDKKFAQRITTGNFDDVLRRLRMLIGLSRLLSNAWISSNPFLNA
ncbi:MAG: 3-hydroxyacyl-CoA dehydrogenase NAD-binding domain-containing protein [Flavobacteriaceae bacterium]